MDENKPKPGTILSPTQTNSQNVAKTDSAPNPISQLSVKAPNHQHHKAIRVINILYAVSIAFNGVLILWGLLDGDNDAGSGFMLLFGIFWAIVGTIMWLLVRLIFWFVMRQSKTSTSYLDIIVAKQRKKAYVSLMISLAQCLLFASYGAGVLFVDKVPSGVTTAILLIGMFIGPVLSWLSILGIIYAIQVFRTPYKNIGILALALQVISIGAVGLWAAIVA